MTAPTGRRIPPLEPGSAEWLGKMSASKVPAVLGLSPYESRFSLWHRMNGRIPQEPTTDEMRRGHYLEPALAQWFQDRHPNHYILAGGCWMHAEYDWYTASPDRLVVQNNTGGDYAVLEIKSDADHDDEWGKDGSEDVPAGVRAQCVAQMDVTGLRTCHVVNIGAFLRITEYVITYSQAEADMIRGQCARFMDTLAKDIRPSIDAHSATYEAVRRLRPGIEDVDVEIGAELARAYSEARTAYDNAKGEKQRTTALMLDAIGSGRRALFLGKVVARRQRKGDAPPHLVAGRSLPTFTESENAA